jgi:hypothetical protein
MLMNPKLQSTKHVDELNKIRLALLGARCSVALIQKTCTRYQEILSDIGDTEPDHLTIVFKDRVAQIGESVHTAAGLQAPEVREQALQSSFTELRMAIDHHLYTIDASK